MPRHWLSNYDGGHAVCVLRLDATDRVWYMDPEATNGFPGEWCSKAVLFAFARSDTAHTIAPISEVGMGLSLTLPAVPVSGTAAIPIGADAIRVSDGTHYTVPVAVNRPAYAVSLATPLSGAGFVVDLNGDVMHFLRAASVGFSPTPAPPPVVATPLPPGLYKVGP